jgi:hypothetical protein
MASDHLVRFATGPRGRALKYGRSVRDQPIDGAKRTARGEVSRIVDLAAGKGLVDRHVKRLLRLTWLAPDVLKRLVVHREPAPSASTTDASPPPCRGVDRH